MNCCCIAFFRILVVMALVLCVPINAAENARAFQQLQPYIDQLVQAGVPGIALQLAHGDSEWAGVAGMSSIESRQVLELNASFPVFSVTKSFTSVVVIQLIEEGKLSFDDSLGDLLPEHFFANVIGPVPFVRQFTVRQLLNHSSGMFDYANSMNYLMATVATGADFDKEWEIEELFAFAHAGRSEPSAAPGSAFNYSSTSYLLLGLVIEEIEQRSLARIYDDRIFTPLSMEGTYLSSYEEWLAPEVTGYILTNKEMQQMGFAGDFPIAEGLLVNATNGQRSRQGKGFGEDGAVSTVPDLMLFTEALFSGELISDEMLVQLTTPQDPNADATGDSTYNFGLGVHLVGMGNQSWVLLQGNGPGGEAIVGRELNSKLEFAALTNVFGAGVVDDVFEKMSSLVREIESN